MNVVHPIESKMFKINHVHSEVGLISFPGYKKNISRKNGAYFLSHVLSPSSQRMVQHINVEEVYCTKKLYHRAWQNLPVQIYKNTFKISSVFHLFSKIIKVCIWCKYYHHFIPVAANFWFYVAISYLTCLREMSQLEIEPRGLQMYIKTSQTWSH